MGYANFLYDYVKPNMSEYLTVLVVVTLIFSVMYLKVMCDKMEIFFLWTCFFGEIFSIADVFFMYKKGLISSYYFSNFIITTAVFFISIFAFQRALKIKQNFRLATMTEPQMSRDEVIISKYSTALFLCFVFLSTLKLLVFGVRTFEKIGAGTGAITRLLWIVTPMSNFCCINLFFTKYRMRSIVFICISIMFSFFSGSKSAVLEMLFCFFVYVFMNPTDVKAKQFLHKAKIPIILVGVTCGAILYGLLNQGTGIDPISGIIHRFIAYGDVYTFAYPYDVLRQVFDGTINFFHYLFGDLLTTFRLADRAVSDEINLAGILVEYVAGPGIAEGPNPRFNVLGLAFFGYFGSIVFSMFCGFIFSLVHKQAVQAVNKSFQVQLIAYVVVNRLICLEQDATLIPQFFTEMVLFIAIYSALSLAFNKGKLVLPK